MNDVTVRRPLTWVSEGATDVGTVRPLNEDSFLCQPEIGLWTVADGDCVVGHDGLSDGLDSVFSYDSTNVAANGACNNSWISS